MNNPMNKWKNAAIPAILIGISIGFVYAFSLFANPISDYIGYSQSKVQFAFSLAIFFLGMAAAFGGSIVERDIHKSTIIGTALFCGGLLVTSLSIYIKSLLLLYVGFGCLTGSGIGIMYLSPVKTLMLWFKDNKGLATGISVCAFGFASTVASPIITYLLARVSLPMVFIILAAIYVVPMTIAHFLLHKPDGWVEPQVNTDFHIKEYLRDKRFISIWIFFFLNITCGLALIPIASPLMTELGVKPTLIALVVSIMGIFNGAGRLVIAALSDKFNKRVTMYYFVFALSMLTAICAIFSHNFSMVALILISAGYGGGFALLPSLVSDIWGMKHVSKQHGFLLSAWGCAGLVGNQLSMFIQRRTGTYMTVFYVIGVLYIIALLLSMTVKVDKVKE